MKKKNYDGMTIYCMKKKKDIPFGEKLGIFILFAIAFGALQIMFIENLELSNKFIESTAAFISTYNK